MTVEHCPQCGAQVAGGRAGCQRLFDELQAKAYADLAYGAMHDLVVDAFCMQHVEEGGRSAKSYAAHLLRLCCAMEHGADPAVYAAIPRWLDGMPTLQRPEPPKARGSITLAEVSKAVSGEDHRRLVRAWARDVWMAYAQQHELARGWMRAALAKGAKVRK